MEFLIENAPKLLSLLTSIVGIFAVIATMTKNSSDNKVADLLLKVINVFGANFGKSKNAE